jgi:hypothetical protein
MSTILQGAQLKQLVLGNGPVSKATGTLADATTDSLFTVAGGEVLVTALWAVCTTTMAGANTLALQTNPTTGDTVTVVAATDLGTTDTAAGTTIGVVDESTTTPDFRKGGRALCGLVVPPGAIELVQTGTGTIDGELTFYCTWVPLTTGATLVAS